MGDSATCPSSPTTCSIRPRVRHSNVSGSLTWPTRPCFQIDHVSDSPTWPTRPSRRPRVRLGHSATFPTQPCVRLVDMPDSATYPARQLHIRHDYVSGSRTWPLSHVSDMAPCPACRNGRLGRVQVDHMSDSRTCLARPRVRLADHVSDSTTWPIHPRVRLADHMSDSATCPRATSPARRHGRFGHVFKSITC